MSGGGGRPLAPCVAAWDVWVGRCPVTAAAAVPAPNIPTAPMAASLTGSLRAHFQRFPPQAATAAGATTAAAAAAAIAATSASRRSSLSTGASMTVCNRDATPS